MKTSLRYKKEIITSPDGIPCKVLDMTSVDFSSAVEGRKTTLTLVRCAKGGEYIETKSAGKVESVCTAQKGDAIFINLFNPEDIYIPGNPDGSRWQFKDLAGKGYETTCEDRERGGVLVRSLTTSKLLHEVIQEPSCIKNLWGEGKHGFFYAGATLKLDDKGMVTGISKEAFDATWEVIVLPGSVSADKPAHSPAKSPKLT